jgi:hypothetical protein
MALPPRSPMSSREMPSSPKSPPQKVLFLLLSCALALFSMMDQVTNSLLCPLLDHSELTPKSS